MPFDGVLNFRDLGGYVASDGRTTRWGRLFRSDALHDLSVEDLVLFRRLGIATVVDLRSADEVEHTGLGQLAREPIQYISAPVLSSQMNAQLRTESDVDDVYLSSRYLSYLEGGGQAFVRAIDEMTVLESYPLVFNCFLGKDRTGVLAALVLSCLGVARSIVIADYALTGGRVPFILEKLRRDPLYRETIDRTNPVLLAADVSTITRFLDLVDERYGGAKSWALSAGLSSRQLEALGDHLLE